MQKAAVGKGFARPGRAALSPFARPAVQCRLCRPRRCRRVVRLGANTLPGLRAKRPKRRVPDTFHEEEKCPF